jgi:murein DD-endopeptidase MepM/ murein hydrolase activator NlpD
VQAALVVVGSRTATKLILVVVALMLVAAMGLWIIIAAVGGETEGQLAAECAGGLADQEDSIISVSTTGEPDEVDGFTAEQEQNASIIIGVGKSRGVPAYGWVVAIATSIQESGLRNLDYGDRDSLGLFQQRPSQGWGTPAQVRDPEYAAGKFYDALVKVEGWQSMPVTVAAQAVQRSGFPDAYAAHDSVARELVQALAGSADVGLLSPAAFNSTSIDCAGGIAAITGDVVFPLPAGTFTDLDNYGESGSRWASYHTGNDLSAPCGTPVTAITDGTVIIRTDEAWAGSWLVQVQTAPGKLTTWYAHMSQLDVKDGQQVTAGQRIGQVGSEGNSSGCHLHVEIHPEGGGYAADDVDPHIWLAQYVGQDIGGIVQAGYDPGGRGFVLSTFNVLGASNTAPGGRDPGRPSGVARVEGLNKLLDQYDVDIVGFQEMQNVQAAEFLRTNSAYRLWYPPGTTSEYAIAWKPTRFQLIQAQSQVVPRYNGERIKMPVVLLRDRTTGRQAWFLNVHHAANTRKYPNQGRWRTEAVKGELKVIRYLASTGVPVFLVGDFNARDSAFCPFTRAGLNAAAGGSTGSPCVLPKRYVGIDWIFGTRGTRFSGHTVDRGPLVRWTTDHPLIVTRAQIGATQ